MNGQKLKFMPAEPISAPENCGILKTEKSNMGRALRCSAQRKAAKATSVATTIKIARGLVKPMSEPCVMKYTRPNTASESVTIPATSSVCA
jgi:hypothetical protein